MAKEPLIIKAYRIKKEQNKALKKIADKMKDSESEFVREGIDWVIGKYLTNK